MNSYLLLQICLVMHLAGLTLIAGSTVVEFLAFRSLSKTYNLNENTVTHDISMLSKLSVLLIIGAVLLVLSGAGFLLSTAAFAHQLWFKIKIALVFGLILNGSLIGGRYEKKLKQCLLEDSSPDMRNTGSAIRNMTRFYFSQLCLFFVIVLLAVFKFN